METTEIATHTIPDGATAPPLQTVLDVMTTEEVARYLGVNKKTLDRMRGRGDGPRYLRLTSKIIRYRRTDIEEFLVARARSNTAQH